MSMGEGSPDMGRESESNPEYSLETNKEFEGFQQVTVTEIDESKPWKPAKTVEVKKADGTVVEGVDANLPFYTFKDKEGNEIIVTASISGHIDKLHIKGEDVGSKFDEPDLTSLFNDLAAKMPEGLAKRKGISTMDIEMGKSMGKEGIASMGELLANGSISSEDMSTAESVKEEVQKLNKAADAAAMHEFVAKYNNEHPDTKIKFTVAREAEQAPVLLPTVEAPKQPTTKLFVMMGPDNKGEKAAIYTVAPGRDMPRHPVPGHYTTADGEFDQAGYNEAAEKWFNTVMLTGE